jgi:hypothetical protein
MVLAELLDSTYDWGALEGNDQNHYSAEFTDEQGKEIEVNISFWRGMWDIEFSRDGTHGITGEGNALKIFGTVVAIVKEFVAAEKPEFMTFSAKKDETSRVKFYKRLAKKLEAVGYTDVTDSGDFEKYGEKIAKHMANEHEKWFLLVRN